MCVGVSVSIMCDCVYVASALEKPDILIVFQKNSFKPHVAGDFPSEHSPTWFLGVEIEY